MIKIRYYLVTYYMLELHTNDLVEGPTLAYPMCAYFLKSLFNAESISSENEIYEIFYYSMNKWILFFITKHIGQRNRVI